MMNLTLLFTIICISPLFGDEFARFDWVGVSRFDCGPIAEPVFHEFGEKVSITSDWTAIGDADINREGGCVLDRPGFYYLCQDVVFSPRASNALPPSEHAVQAAITITSSHVFLYLGKHKLSQYIPEDPKQQVPYVIGISVPDMAQDNPDPDFKALESVYIWGDDRAKIVGFSMYGIRIFGHIYDVRLSQILIQDCGHLASKAFRPFPNYLPHDDILTLSTQVACPIFGNFAFGPAFGVGGLVIGESNRLGMGPKFFTQTTRPQNRVDTVEVDNVICTNNFFTHLVLANATHIVFTNIELEKTYSDDCGDPAISQEEIPINTDIFYTDKRFIFSEHEMFEIGP